MDFRIKEEDIYGSESSDILDISGPFLLADQDFALTDNGGFGSSLGWGYMEDEMINENQYNGYIVAKDEISDNEDYIETNDELIDIGAYVFTKDEIVQDHSLVEKENNQNEVINANLMNVMTEDQCDSTINDKVKTHRYNFRLRKTIPKYTDTAQTNDLIINKKRKGRKVVKKAQKPSIKNKFDPPPVFTDRGLAILRRKKNESNAVPPQSPPLMLTLSQNEFDISTLPPQKLVKKRVRYPKEELTCYICPYVSTVLLAMKRHFTDHKLHGINLQLKYSCEICGQDAASQLQNEYHMEKSHIEQGNLYCCDTCHFKTDQLKKLIQHRRKHTGEKPHHCTKCSYKSTRRDNLHSHARRCHDLPRMDQDTFTQPILDWDAIITDANNNALPKGNRGIFLLD